MRRRPEEDHAEEGKGCRVQGARRRGPAHERGYRSGGAADDDVVRRRALEPDRVDEDVDERARERKRRGEQVRPGPQHPEREPVQRDADDQRVRGRDPSARDGAAARAGHLGVDVAVEPAVDRVRATGRERAANEHRHHREQARVAVRRGDHDRDRGRVEQHNDP